MPTVGRAFPIRDADVRSYDAAARPRMRANPMGVTTLATINGRGASARAAAQGRSRAERIARARTLMRGRTMNANTHRAAFVSAMRENRKGRKGRRRKGRKGSRAAGKRLGRYSSMVAKYRRAGRTKTDAKRLARKKVFGKNARKNARRGSYSENRRRSTANRRARRNEAIRPSQMREVNATLKQLRDREKQIKREMNEAIKKARQEATSAKRAAAKKIAEEKKAKGKALRAQRKELEKKKRSKGMRGRIRRKYKRASLRDPSSGRARKSYMYRDKKGRLRKIPWWVLAGGTGAQAGDHDPKKRDRIMEARRRASQRVLQGKDPFTPNRSRKMNENKKRRRKGRRRKSTKKSRGKKLGRYNRMVAKYRKKGYPKSKARRLAKKKVYGTGKKRRKGGKRRRKGGKRRRRARRNSSFSSNRRGAVMEENRKGRRRRRKGSKRRRKGRKGRRRARRNYRRNGLMADLKAVLKVGSLVVVGFVAHKALTWAADTYLFSMLTTPKAGAAQSETQGALANWGRPISGAIVGVAGIGLAGMAFKGKPDAVKAIGAGMVASFVQDLLKTVLLAAGQPGFAAGISGLGAFGRRRRRGRRGMRGTGAYTSIAPQYTQVGQFQQAQAGYGEYFTPTAVGEYFIPTSALQGVGNYEEAGPMALQASAGTGQIPIDDGIRPDSDLDRVLTLAEAAAGVGASRTLGGLGRRPMGEYYTASPSGGGGYTDTTVGTDSQWIPNGPLWAGELGVRDTQADSDLPAGTLTGPGGNGILSG